MVTQVNRFSKRALDTVASSIKLTLVEIGLAVKGKEPSRIIALLREGSPLEATINDLLYYVFVALLFAPIVIVPAYYLFLTLAG